MEKRRQTLSDKYRPDSRKRTKEIPVIRLLACMLLILIFPVTASARISVNTPASKEGHTGKPIISADAVIQKEDNSDITDLSVDPTGKYIITANTLGKIRLWDFKTGLLLRTYSDKSVEEQGTQVIVAPTGDYILSHGTAGIKKWSLSENKVLRSFSGYEFIGRIAIDAKGEILINANAPSLMVWNLREDKPNRVITDRHRFYGVFESLVISPDGRHCFTGYADGLIVQWDLKTGLAIKEIQEHKNRVRKLLIDPSRRHLVSVAEDGSIIVWNAKNLAVVRTIGSPPADIKNWNMRDHIHTAAIDPQGQVIATGGSQGHISIWSFTDGRFIRKIEKPEEGIPSASSMAGIASLAFDPSGRILIAAGELGAVRLWDFNEGKIIRSLSGTAQRGYNPSTGETGKLPSIEAKSHDLADTQSIISVDKYLKYIVSKTNKDGINVWDVQSLRMLLHFSEKTLVTHCILDPNGRYAITGSKQNSIDIYDLRTGTLLRKLQPALQQQKIAYLKTDPFGKRIIAIHTGTAPFPQNLSVKTLTLWDLETGKLLLMADGCDKALVDPRGRYLAGLAGDNTLKIWNLKTGKPIRTMKCGIGSGVAFDIIQEGKLIVIGYPDRTLQFWDVRSGARTTVRPEGDEARKSVEIDGSGRYIIYSVQERLSGYGVVWRNFNTIGSDPMTDDGEYPRPHRYYISPRPNDRSISYTTATVRSVATGRILCRIEGHRSELSRVEVDPTGRYAISVSDDRINIWDLRTAKLVRSLKTNYSTVGTAFDQSGEYLAAAANDSMVSIWSMRTGELIKKIPGINFPLRFRIMNKNPLSTQPIVVSTTKDNLTALVELLTGNKLKIGEFGFENRISPDYIIGDYILSETAYNGITLWNAKKGHNITFVSKDKEWLAWSSNGYFDSSRQGGSLMYMVKDTNTFGIDQFAIKNNRPDRMLRGMGLGSDELISHFYGQYQKRLRKSGFAEEHLSSELHVPEAKILDTGRNDNIMKITYSLRDTRYNLKKFNVYVNDVPLFGAVGKEITGMTVTGTEQVKLTGGKNKIEVTCINEKGAESYRALTYAEVKSDNKGDLYYLGFGVSRYRDRKLNLKYADKDARDLAAVFERMKGHFKTVYTKVYANEEVITTTIKQAGNFLKDVTANDTVVLFIAGHGLHDRDKESTYYYLTYNASLEKLAATAAPFELIEDLLQDIAARKKLFLIDTCESGDLDDALQNRYFSLAQARGFLPRSARAIRVRVPSSHRRAFVYDTNRYIYNDLSRRTGAVVFSSSRGAELSYESDNLKNGFFTRELINALTTTKADKDGDGLVSKEELEAYVSDSVSRLSDDLQHPTIDKDNIYQKIFFPLTQMQPGLTQHEVDKSANALSIRASFDCNRAADDIEKSICNDKTLADADFKIGALYKDLLSHLSVSDKKRLKKEQIDWVRKRNVSCSGAAARMSCLRTKYASRIEALKKWK